VKTTTTSAPKLFLTLDEASKSCGVSKDTLRGAVAAGKLRAKRTGPNAGGLYLFRVRDLEDWFDGLAAA
jgi:excisionase family DNA binding protein